MASLYLISPPQFDIGEFAPKLEACLATGKVGAFQLRLKHISEEEILFVAETLIPICWKHNVPFILNDSVKLAKQCGADGVHLGEESDDYETAREILGEKAHIGISCYADYDRAAEFAAKGADLVSFGQFFATKTKPPKGWADIALIEKWKANQTVSCSAIGGLTPERAKPIAAAGADYTCVVSYIWDSEKPEEQVLKF